MTIAPIIAGPIAAYLPFLVISQQRAKRMARIEEQIPDAIDTMTRALKAGHPFSATLRMIAEDMDDPVAGKLDPDFLDQTYQLVGGGQIEPALPRGEPLPGRTHSLHHPPGPRARLADRLQRPAVSVAAAPVTGVPLPFISQGGSFFLAMSIDTFREVFGTEWFIRRGAPVGTSETWLFDLD